MLACSTRSATTSATSLAGHLAQREHELVRLVLDQEVVGEDDGLLLEVAPFEGAQFLHGGGHHAL
jgi:hypothetical protein